MAGQGTQTSGAIGPGNKAIAIAALERLAVRGRTAARERAARALGPAAEDLHGASAWLSEAQVTALFSAADLDTSFARALGHRLVSPDATGLRLYALGLATPEKAYRRVQALLPRESSGARWTVLEIERQGASLRFEPDRDGGPDSVSDATKKSASGTSPRSAEFFCALRRGMLEAIPGLYGLIPARVDETTCVARGDRACCYHVSWTSTSRTSTIIGAVTGLGLALGVLLTTTALEAFGPASGPLGVVMAGLVFLLGPSLGAVHDLWRQLEAVAGARRGHLALFDQVDEALAAKLDALTRAEATLEGPSDASPVRRTSPPVSGGSPRPAELDREILAAAHQIHSAAGDLECWFDETEAAAGSEISDERGLVREIREWAARLEKLGDAGTDAERQPVDLVKLVGRAIATARPSLPPRTCIELDVEDALPKVECAPVQIEHVVVQLVQNAVEASVEISDAPEVDIALVRSATGVELSVADRGIGIESAAIDEVFDPFFGDRPPGAGQGLGLTVCLRIIERHGGEMRIENQERAGTRVTVVLPERSAGGEPA